ncbi:Ig-like domain-containing protein [Patescibacteria group bacterium]
MIKNKVSKFHFPTIVGLLILLIAVFVGVYLVKTRTGIKTGAEESETPKQVRITNVTDTGFSVSWVTDKAAVGIVKYDMETGSFKQSALDDRDQLSGEAGAFSVHHVTVKNLTPSTKYYFKIESGKNSYDNKGQPFEITTGKTLGAPPAADPVYGTILTPSGTAAEGVVVYVNVANAAPLSALAKTNGNWALSLSTARGSDLSSYLNYDTQATIVNILVQGGTQGTAPAITTTANDNPVPDITLGQSHDFRSVASTAVNQVGDEGMEGTSGFADMTATESATTATYSGEVTLDNPSVSGEIINATQPAFIGTGPPGTVLSVEVNSEDTYTGTVTIDEDGEWEFSPPEGLTAGNHEVTVTYIDSEGVEQVLTRNFVIAAAGESDEPAITATPSGSVSTDSGRTSMPATDSGVPDPGSGEMTLIMLLVGVGLLLGGVRIKNRV